MASICSGQQAKESYNSLCNAVSWNSAEWALRTNVQKYMHEHSYLWVNYDCENMYICSWRNGERIVLLLFGNWKCTKLPLIMYYM